MKRAILLFAVLPACASCAPVESGAGTGGAVATHSQGADDSQASAGSNAMQKLIRRFPGAVLLDEGEFAKAIEGRGFSYRQVGSEVVVNRPTERFAAGGRYTVQWLRTVSFGRYSIEDGVVAIDCNDCPNAFLGLTWRRIFFRHGEGLFMADASGEGSVIQLI